MPKKRDKKPARQPERPQKAASAWGPRALSLADRYAIPATVALVLIASLRIVSTYTVFNHTADEPGHIACGMEYVDKKVYRYEHHHPPLARAMVALFPYLAGARSHMVQPRPNEGIAILYDNYDKYLALARLGILPFFWAACFVVYFWGRRYFGKPIAVTAVLLFTLLPPVLAHAGLATTDMALTACLSAAFLAALIWAEHPTWLHSLAFGAATGLAVLSKFSTLPFFPCAVIAALAWHVLARRPSVSDVLAQIRQRALPLLVALVVAAVVIWAGYLFSFGKVWFAGFRLPAPEFYSGIRDVMAHNKGGHPSYLLGQFSLSGWWYYYPVALAVKTPLAFLLLLAFGIVAGLRRYKDLPLRFPLAFSLGVLAFGLTSRINIGVRHVMPVYIGFSIMAAISVVELVRLSQTARWATWTLAGLLAWLVLTGALKHPDYLAYFNELAGDEPERILVDSDLDWGQDVKRLGRRLREAGAQEVAFTSFFLGDMEGKHGFPHVKSVNPIVPNAEWVAVSPTAWKTTRHELLQEHPNAQFWMDGAKPHERVGSMLLWHFPAAHRQP